MDTFENKIPGEENPTHFDDMAAEPVAEFTESASDEKEIPAVPAESLETGVPEELTEDAPASESEAVLPAEAEAAAAEKNPAPQTSAEETEAGVEAPVMEQQHEAAEQVPPVSPYANSPYVINKPVQRKVSRKKRRKHGVLKTVISAVLILALVVSACGITAGLMDRQWQWRVDQLEADFQSQLQQLQQQVKYSGSGISVSGTPNVSSDGSLTPAQVYAKNVKSVVMIYNSLNNGTATGSGFILSEAGHVVTNHHVIEGGGKLTVVTYDGREFPAKLVGSDSTNDVALLKVEGEDLQPVTVGNSDNLIVGDQVVAIGNPLGELTSTLTVGYISAKERDVNTEGFAINMLQTDAAINSGNSGGPLFNMKGEVIGITTAKYSGTSSSGATIEGVGFAIPINDVEDMLADLMNYGYITGAYLGVRVSDMDPAAASYYNMPVGVYVQSVDEGFAAQRAGIQPKDIIVKLGDIEVTTVNDLTRALRRFQAGDEVVVVVYRSGGEMKLTAVLDPKPAA